MTAPAVTQALSAVASFDALAAAYTSAQQSVTSLTAQLTAASAQIAALTESNASLSSALTEAQASVATLTAQAGVLANQRNAVAAALLALTPSGTTITWETASPWFTLSGVVVVPPPPPPVTTPPTSSSSIPASLAATIALVEPSGSKIQIPGMPLTVTPATVLNGQWKDDGVTFENWSPNTISSTGELATNLSRCPDGSGLRMTYGPTLAGGNSPVRWGAAIAGLGTGYGCFAARVRLSSNWTLSKSAELKLFEPRSAGAENHVVVGNCYGAAQDGSNEWVGTLLQFAGNVGNRYVPGNPGASAGWADSLSYFLNAAANIGAKRGSWCDIAVGFYPEPVAGQAGAVIKIAVNSMLVFDSSKPGALGVPTAGLHLFNTVRGWQYFMVDPCYGGDVATDHPPALQYYDVDSLYASTK